MEQEDEERPTWDDLGDAGYDQEEEGDGGYDQYAYGAADEEMVEEQEVVYDYEDDGPINMVSCRAQSRHRQELMVRTRTLKGSSLRRSAKRTRRGRRARKERWKWTMG